MYYHYQHSATCFDTYCAIFRENFILCSKVLLQCLITALKTHFIYCNIYIFWCQLTALLILRSVIKYCNIV